MESVTYRVYAVYIFLLIVTLILMSVGIYYLFESIDVKNDYLETFTSEKMPLLTVPEVESNILKLSKIEDGYELVIKDGPGSNLNSDLLDGLSSEDYQNISNIKNGELAVDFYSAIKDLEAEGYIVDGKFRSDLFYPTYEGNDLDAWSGSTNITKVGKIVSGEWRSTPITSQFIADKTILLADLAGNGCSEGQVIKWSTSFDTWYCANDQGGTASNIAWENITGRPSGLDDGDDDTILSESQVESYITNSNINLAAGSQVSGANIATENWVNSRGYLTLYSETDPLLASWTGSGNISAVGTINSGTWHGSPLTSQYIQDGTIQFADLAQNGCSDGQMISWNQISNGWNCITATVVSPTPVSWATILNRPAGLDDGDNVLSEAQVEGYISNGLINLAAGSQMSSQNLATQNWVSSQGYLTVYTETDPNLTSWSGSTNIATVGTITSGSWQGSPLTSQYITNGTILLEDLGQNGCSDGQVMKWESDLSTWICSNDLEGSGGVSVTPVYEKWDPDAPPQTPSAYDDEFNDASVNPNWAAQGSGVLVESQGMLQMHTDSHYVNKTLPSGDFTIWSKISSTGSPQLVNYSQVLLGVQSGTGTLYTIGMTGLNTNSMKIEVIQWSNFLNWVSTPMAYVIEPQNNLYVAIKRSSSTLSFWISTDGISYNRVYTVNDPGVNKMGLILSGSVKAYFDFFRYVPVYTDHKVLLEGRTVAVGGGSVSAIASSVISAEGDLIVGNASNQESRLAKGTAGQVLTVNNTGTTIEWADPPQIKWARAYGTTDVSKSTNTWEDMPDMLINLTTGASPVEMNFSAGVGNANASGITAFRMLIDGVVVGTQTKVRVPNVTVGSNANLIWIENLAAGPHVFKVQWNSEVGTSYNRALGGTEHRTLIVKEY